MNNVESRVLYFEPSPNCHRQRQTFSSEATSRVKVEIILLKMEMLCYLEDIRGLHARDFPWLQINAENSTKLRFNI
jgi:hypothetical protein